MIEPASQQPDETLRTSRALLVRQLVDRPQRPAIMGILNVTPDSFSDGGLHHDTQSAIDAALQMERDGAAIIDVGGESTRPGSDAVDVDAELERVVPVIEGIRRRSRVAISIDTRKEAVARAALDAGADIVNDVSALRHDPALAGLVAGRGVPVILMHMRGDPRTMQSEARYGEVVHDVAEELAQRRTEALAAGITEGQILIDPGIGFAKTGEHNLELLARCHELAHLGPLVIGASRKAFVGQLTGQPVALRGWPARWRPWPRRTVAGPRSFAFMTCVTRLTSSRS